MSTMKIEINYNNYNEWIGPAEQLYDPSGMKIVPHWNHQIIKEEIAPGVMSFLSDQLKLHLFRVAVQRAAAGWPRKWWLDASFSPAKYPTPEHLFYLPIASLIYPEKPSVCVEVNQ